MERRFDPRYPATLDVTVVDIEAGDRKASGWIVDVSESGVCADLSLSLEAGTTVKIAVGDCALFGHVTYSTERPAEGDTQGQTYRTGIEVVRVLIGDSDLAKLVKAVLAESMPSTPGVRVDPT